MVNMMSTAANGKSREARKQELRRVGARVSMERYVRWDAKRAPTGHSPANSAETSRIENIRATARAVGLRRYGR